VGKLIYQKWAFAIILIVIFVILFTSTTVYLNSNIYSDSKKITHKDLPLTIYAFSMIDKFNNMSSNLLEYSHGEMEEKNEFFINLEEYNHYFAQLKETNKIYNIKLPVSRLLRVSEDYINSANRVFLLYNPKNEMWAILEVDKIEHSIAKKLENKLEELRKKPQTTLKQNIILLELIDEAGDLLASLSEYVSGEMDEIEEYESNTKEFNSFIKQLEASGYNQKYIDEIKELQKNLYNRSYTIFDTYNPQNKRKALKLIDYMEHNQFKELESILNILASNSINSKEKIMTSIEESLDTANYISVAMAIFTIIISIMILKNLYKNFNQKVKNLLEKQESLEKELKKKEKELNKLSSKININTVSDEKEFTFRKAKILIADDIQENINLITAYYKNKNLEFIEAINGQEAVELTKKKKPDLVLMDLKMPIMNGYEACELIRKDSQINYIPIIAMSSSVLDRNILLLEKDFNGYISRPIDFSILDKELSKYLK